MERAERIKNLTEIKAEEEKKKEEQRVLDYVMKANKVQERREGVVKGLKDRATLAQRVNHKERLDEIKK